MSLATLLLIVCLLIAAVDITMADSSFLEKTHGEVKSYETLSSRLSDIVSGTQQLLDYMRGKENSIYIEGVIGERMVEMFPSEIEIVHMREVRNLWQSVVTIRNFTALFAVSFFVLGIILQKRALLASCGRAIAYAYFLFLIVALFIVIWAISDFDGFWTFFHQVAFPSSDNWLLPEGTNMIEMLPALFFAKYVTRIGITAALLVAPPILLALGMLLRLRILTNRKERRTQPKAAARDPLAEIIVSDAPDLLSLHRKMNKPLSKRDVLAEPMPDTTETEEGAEALDE